MTATVSGCAYSPGPAATMRRAAVGSLGVHRDTHVLRGALDVQEGSLDARLGLVTHRVSPG